MIQHLHPSAHPRTWVLLACTLIPTLTSCGSPKTGFSSDEPLVLQSKEGLAIKGYDPVTYFTDNEAVRGVSSITATYEGATYSFTTEANRRLFLSSPSRYVPAYGGWCAWAVATGEGSLVPVNPRSFLIEEGRLFLFYDSWLADTRRSWLRGARSGLRSRGDKNWNRMRNAR